VQNLAGEEFQERTKLREVPELRGNNPQAEDGFD
jgi:hypothetical protein